MAVSIGFTATEAGVFPSDWPIRPLGDLFEFSGGHSASRAQLSDVGYCYLHYGDIHGARKSSIDTRADFLAIPKLPIALRDVSSRSMLDDGDVVFVDASEDDEGASKHIVVINRDRIPFIAGLHTIVAKSKSDVLAPEYRRYCFQTSSIRSQFLFYAVGTKVTGISKSNIPKLLLPVPPLPEQRAIAAALSDVDSLLEALDRLIAKKRDLKQAAMQQLLTGKTRLPGFKEDWGLARVQDVVERAFCGPSPTCEERNIQNDREWGVLKTTAATVENGWDWTKHKTLPRSFWNKSEIELKRGDVIVTKAGPRHRVGVAAWVSFIPPRVIPSGKMIALRPRMDKVIPRMLAAAISAKDTQAFLDQRTTGMAESQVNFENSVLLEAPILIPRLDEQAAIATILADMEAEIEAFKSRRAKVHSLKGAMMQELLTGKIRLVSREAVHA